MRFKSFIRKRISWSWEQLNGKTCRYSDVVFFPPHLTINHKLWRLLHVSSQEVNENNNRFRCFGSFLPRPTPTQQGKGLVLEPFLIGSNQAPPTRKAPPTQPAPRRKLEFIFFFWSSAPFPDCPAAAAVLLYFIPHVLRYTHTHTPRCRDWVAEPDGVKVV